MPVQGPLFFIELKHLVTQNVKTVKNVVERASNDETFLVIFFGHAGESLH